jgi:serine/threonine protein phosphatase 1
VLSDAKLIYAVGDLHGRLDLHKLAETWIASDAASLGLAPTILILGDFVDRGPDTSALIDRLITAPQLGKRICLCGNHEAAFVDFIAAPDRHSPWLEFGGEETLMSYGIFNIQQMTTRDLSYQVAARIPDEHLTFLKSLPVSVESHNNYFSHAGVRPGVTLERQATRDLMWFRDSMSSDYLEFPKRIVHGHQVVSDPYVSKRRVNLDLGAYATGRLAVLRTGSRVQEEVAIITRSGGSH